MSDTLREVFQFILGGGGLALAVVELIRRWWIENPRLEFLVTGRAKQTKTQQLWIEQIHVRITNRSSRDNSISECWLEWESKTARPPTCRMRTAEIRTVTDGKRILRVVSSNFEIEPSAIEFPLFLRAQDTVEGFVVFSAPPQILTDIGESATKLRIRDSHSKWNESSVDVSATE
jgi:hypothetical protein